jgi:PAT family beta-lactamase induction signal transducer AmpG
MDIRVPASPERTAHPIAFAALFFPFGASGGFFGVALTYLLHRNGVTTAEIGGLIGLSILPNVIKVFWAPLFDSLLTPKLWYLIGVVIVGVGVAALGFMPLGRADLVYLGPTVFLLNVAATFTSISTEALMAHGTAAGRLGQAGGWSQVGNLGGASLGGGAGLWLATHASPGVAGAALGSVIICCAAALLVVPPASLEHRRASYLGTIRAVVADVWAVAWSRTGGLTLLVFLLPLGTGVAGGYFSAISGEWKASANLVALVSGIAASVAATIGAIAGGYICDWLDRKTAYVLLSLAQAAVAVGMACAPRTPETFALFALAYAATTSLAFAAYAALTLETIGAGAAATKFNLMASVANTPLLYVNAIEGPVQTKYGSTAMLLTEAALGVAGAAIFALVAVSTRQRRPAPAATG